MEFKKYQKIRRYGEKQNEGIEVGECYVFPKIDGTNASIWLGDDGEICGGSRNRQVSLDKDNQGFYEWLIEQDNIKKLFNDFPDIRLYGEWLVPHSLKAYRDDVWENFWCFDVMRDGEYLHYDEYKPLLQDYNVDYVPPLAKVKDGDYENFVHYLDKNDFLLKDEYDHSGEGIVLKNYDYENYQGKQRWAKIVTSKFKEKHHKEMGAPLHENKPVEREIVDTYVTEGRVDKIYQKIKNDCDGWQSEYIPRLLQTVYYDLVIEEAWNFVKEHNNPRIDFSKVKHMAIQKTKEHKSELF